MAKHAEYQFNSSNTNICGELYMVARKIFPNPENSRYGTPFRILKDMCNYREFNTTITAFGNSYAESKELIEKLKQTALVNLIDKNTILYKGPKNPKLFNEFFKTSNTRTVGKYTFRRVIPKDTKAEAEIIINREKVLLANYEDAQSEFYKICAFLRELGLNKEDSNNQDIEINSQEKDFIANRLLEITSNTKSN